MDRKLTCYMVKISYGVEILPYKYNNFRVNVHRITVLVMELNAHNEILKRIFITIALQRDCFTFRQLFGVFIYFLIQKYLQQCALHVIVR